ncbi:hypothetical protein DFH11DRAFT_1546734 [Phellopilus nigrolimitatus]|nr:hypothetical protein DFH11DRAFT_1546734 [Phellopilus nigrolimitatus]
MDQEVGSIASPPDVVTTATLNDRTHKSTEPQDTTETSWMARKKAGSYRDEGATHHNECEVDVSAWLDLDGLEGNVWDDAIPLGDNAGGGNSLAPHDYPSYTATSSAYLDLTQICSPERYQVMMSGDDSNVWIQHPNDEEKEIFLGNEEYPEGYNTIHLAEPEQEQQVARIPQQIPELSSLRLQLDEHPAPTASVPSLPIDAPGTRVPRRGLPFMSSAATLPTDFLSLPPLPPLPIDAPRTRAPRRGLPESFAFQPTFASPSFDPVQESMLAFSRTFNTPSSSSYSSGSTPFSSGSSSRTPDDAQGDETSFLSLEQAYPFLDPVLATSSLPETFLPPTSDVDVSGLFQTNVAAQHVPLFCHSAATPFPKQPFGNTYHNLPRDTVAPAAVQDKKRKGTAKANGKTTAKAYAKTAAKKTPVHASSSTSSFVEMTQPQSPFHDYLPTCADAAKYTRANAPAMSSSAPYKTVEYCDFLVRTCHGTLVRCGHVLSTDRDDVKAHFNKHKRSFDQGADIPCPYCFGAMKRYSNICRHIEDSHTILNKPKCPNCNVPITRNDDFYRTRHLASKEHKNAVKALAVKTKKVSRTASNSLTGNNLEGGDLEDGDFKDDNKPLCATCGGLCPPLLYVYQSTLYHFSTLSI